MLRGGGPQARLSARRRQDISAPPPRAPRPPGGPLTGEAFRGESGDLSHRGGAGVAHRRQVRVHDVVGALGEGARNDGLPPRVLLAVFLKSGTEKRD